MDSFIKTTDTVLALAYDRPVNIQFKKQIEVGLSATADELAEKKIAALTAELRESRKELETLSYTISHDLQAPLRMLMGFSQILLEDYASQMDDQGKEFLHIIDSNAQKMSELISELIDYSKINAAPPQKEETDMDLLVAGVIDEIKHSHPDSKAVITASALQHAVCDSALMRRVWSHLIGNAVKYSSKKESPVIEIGMIDGDHLPVYYIKDNGAGFDMKYAYKLFGVFQRLHEPDDFAGNGIGLATARRVIVKHGVQIWAEGHKGIGATFYFTLPQNS